MSGMVADCEVSGESDSTINTCFNYSNTTLHGLLLKTTESLVPDSLGDGFFQVESVQWCLNREEIFRIMSHKSSKEHTSEDSNSLECVLAGQHSQRCAKHPHFHAEA